MLSQSGSGERPIEDVRRAEGDEEFIVVRRRGRDDGRETGQFRELDGCAGRGVSVYRLKWQYNARTYRIGLGRTRLP